MKRAGVAAQIVALALAACASPVAVPRRDIPPPEPIAKPAALPAAEQRPVPNAPADAERALGVSDRGVYSDLDDKLQLPAPRAEQSLAGLVDARRGLFVVYADGWPYKIYPLGGGAELRLGGERLSLRPGDRAELASLSFPVRRLGANEVAPPGDHDDDGIPDPLDLLIGAEKTVLDAAEYDDAYFSLRYPAGDPPRNRGACVDVVVRAVRNAGVDLQQAIIEDERKNAGAYGVKSPDVSIDHRRVRNAIVYFKRHWVAHGIDLTDSADRWLPGDVVFLDTFASRPGPDHVGIVTPERGPSGHPLIVNLWTFGYRTGKMDLLGAVPITHRFRFPSRMSRGPAVARPAKNGYSGP